MATTELREFDLDRDAGTLAALLTAGGKDPISSADVREMMRRDASLDHFRAVIAVDGTAYARTFRQPWFTDGLYGTGVVVHPDVRKRGIGGSLLETITGIGRSLGATSQVSSVRDGRPDSLAFALRRGFTVDRHVAKSTLDPASVDPSLAVPPPPGITITTLVALGDTDANRRRLWQITERTAADIPGDRRKPRTYEEFTRQMLEVSWFRAAGQFIALDGDVWAGVAAVGYTESRNLLYHNMTGVDRAYRGRGIASALKWATIAYAISTGASALETHNDSSNAPMLAINRAFGYRAEPGYSDLSRMLVAD